MVKATALIPFVPSGPDFELALAFFAELGFAAQWRNGGLAGLRFGAAAFMLQDIDVPEWQKNQMLTLEVDDLDAYWHDIAGKRLETRFAGVRLKEPHGLSLGPRGAHHRSRPACAGTCARRRPPNPQPNPPRKTENPTMAADPENTLVIETTKGRVVIELRPDLAPKHVERIKQLAREGFYDGIAFHRVIDGFMAQTGCPKGTGTGGSSYPNLKAEFNAEPHVRGVCSMARSSIARQRQQPVLHRVRRRHLPRQAVHGVGQGHRGHGERRQDQARRAGAAIPTRWSR